MKVYRVFYRYEETSPVSHLVVRGFSPVDAMQCVSEVLTSYTGSAIIYGASEIKRERN